MLYVSFLKWLCLKFANLFVVTVNTDDDNPKQTITTEQSLPEEQHNQQDDLKGITTILTSKILFSRHGLFHLTIFSV